MNTRPQTTRVLYFTALGLFYALFIVSILLSVFDVKGTLDGYRHLSFPTWLLIPQATAKALGLIAIAQNRWRTLKDFAYAGFLYNLLLALGAHVALRELDVLLALLGLLLWVFAFTMDRRYHGRRAEGEDIALDSERRGQAGLPI